MYIGKRVPMNERLTECSSRSTKYKINLLNLISKKSYLKILSGYFGTPCRHFSLCLDGLSEGGVEISENFLKISLTAS